MPLLSVRIDGVEINWEEQRKSGEKVQPLKAESGNAIGFEYLEAEAKHRGMYKCVGHYDGKKSEHEFLVRIKGKGDWKKIKIEPFLSFRSVYYTVENEKHDRMMGQDRQRKISKLSLPEILIWLHGSSVTTEFSLHPILH